LGLRAFAAFHYFEFHLLALFQGAEALSLDIAVMHEDIGAAFLGNEPVALGITEPLYLAPDSHYLTSKMLLPGGASPAKIRGKLFPHGKAYGLLHQPGIYLNFIKNPIVVK
jgi:hypothetical protein